MDNQLLAELQRRLRPPGGGRAPKLEYVEVALLLARNPAMEPKSIWKQFNVSKTVGMHASGLSAGVTGSLCGEAAPQPPAAVYSSSDAAASDGELVAAARAWHR